MPLEELTPLGYEVIRHDREADPNWIWEAEVHGHGRDFILHPGDDEGALVQDAKNHAALYGKLTQAQGVFQDNYTNWASLSAAQKDTAARNAQRAIANLIRHVRNDLTSEGV